MLEGTDRFPERIGLGTYGLSWMVRDLNKVAYDLLRNLHEDIVDKKTQLNGACVYHVNNDEANRAALAAANAAFLADRVVPDFYVQTSKGKDGKPEVVIPGQGDEKFDKSPKTPDWLKPLEG